jgi:hypothetical protein
MAIMVGIKAPNNCPSTQVLVTTEAN